MEGYLEWSDIPENESKSTQKKHEYLWLKSGKKYRVRPVHYAVPLFKYFHRDAKGMLRTALCPDPDKCEVALAHPELKKPSRRYAIYVIDREDGKLKIMEGPKSVFLPLKKRFEATGKNPGGSDTGGDWQIEITGKGQKNTTYSVVFLEDTPLSGEEKQLVKEVMEDEKRLFKNIYKVNTPEEIEKRLFGEYENKDNDSKSSTAFIENNNSQDDSSPTDSSPPADSEDFNW